MSYLSELSAYITLRVGMLRRVADLRHCAAIVINVITIAIAGLFLGLLFFTICGLFVSIPEYFRIKDAVAQGRPLSVDEMFAGGLLQLWFILPPIIYVGIFLFPFIFTLPINSLVIALWESPPKLVFLRPFHRGALGRPLKRIARSQIARFGHIYTLSDTDIHVPWYVRVPLLFGQMAFLSFRVRKLSSPEKLPALQRAMHRSWLRNINWCMSWNKIFAIATVDALWQRVVDLLLSESAVVIVDISSLRANVAWEIERSRGRAENQVLYLVAASQQQDSVQTLALLLNKAPDELTVFPYNDSGLLQPERLRSALSSTLAKGRSSSDEASQHPKLFVILGTICFGIGVVPLLCLMLPMLRIGLPLWNSWPDNATHWPGFSAFLNVGVLKTEAFGIFTWLLLLIASRVGTPIRFLFTLQTFLLLATPLGLAWQ